jgi:hypothetical protein
VIFLKITGVSSYLPEKTLTDTVLEKMFETTCEPIAHEQVSKKATLPSMGNGLSAD